MASNARTASRLSRASLALLMLCGGCADKLILFPSTGRLDAAGAARREIRTGAGIVEVWVARSPGSDRMGRVDAFVLEFTGNATRAEDVAIYDALVWGERPIELWAMNYPGYGGSTGPARLCSIPAAALAAYDALAEQANGRPVFVSGVSLGTAAALHVAANRPAAGVILQNPPPLRQMILRGHGWWNLWVLAGIVAAGVPSELDSISNARRCTAPAVFLLAEHDEIVPPKYQRLVGSAYAGPVRVIHLAGATHNAPLEARAVNELAQGLDWLWTHR